jgi:cobalt-zinc-cadmium efflux system membrane fusion protein
MKRMWPLVVLLLAGCRRVDKAADAPAYKVDGDVVTFADPAAQAATVTVEPLAQGVEERVRVTGRLAWDEDLTARVFPPVSGRVVRILADLGAPVQAGSVLASLSSPDFGQAQADAARAAADFTASSRALERVRLLLERGAVPRKDVEQAEAEAERARAETERTRTRLALWGGDHGHPGSVDQSFDLASPLGGVVVERNLNPGQEVRSDATVPLFVISDPRRLWVVLDLMEKNLGEIAKGTELRVKSPAFPDRVFEGRLELIGAALDPATRTVRARARVQNPEGLLRAEMYVAVDLARAEASPHLVLPARAVIRDGDGRFVFREEAAGRYRRVPVTVGMESEGLVSVVSGLAATARVVTEGSLLLEAAWAVGR